VSLLHATCLNQDRWQQAKKNKINQLMKNILFLLILISVSCNQQKSNKTYLANYVDTIKEENSLSENPLVIIDGQIEEYEMMNDGAFLLLEIDIVKTEYLKKETASNIYGERGKNGAVLVTTVLSNLDTQHSNTDKKTLYVLDGKIITNKEFEKIDQNIIIGIGTITDKKAIKEYSKDKYDQLIYISTKMPSE
jgi:hypothetical protein